jgi:hypothetical protein
VPKSTLPNRSEASKASQRSRPWREPLWSGSETLQIVNQEQYNGELITPTLTDFRDNSPKSSFRGAIS